MDIVLSQNSQKPIYTQIYEQISSQILCGALTAGTKLPPIRTVALDLRISVIPVKQAWEQLESEGFIRTQTGSGTFVQRMEVGEIQRKRSSAAGELLGKAVDACRSMGLSKAEVLEIAASAYDRS